MHGSPSPRLSPIRLRAEASARRRMGEREIESPKREEFLARTRRPALRGYFAGLPSVSSIWRSAQPSSLMPASILERSPTTNQMS